MEKYQEINDKYLKDQLGEEILKNYKLIFKQESKAYKLRDNKKNVIHNIENLNWGNWNYNQPIILEKNSAGIVFNN